MLWSLILYYCICCNKYLWFSHSLYTFYCHYCHFLCILSIVSIVTSSVYFLFLLVLPPVCLYPFMSSITLCNYKCLHCILKEDDFSVLSKSSLQLYTIQVALSCQSITMQHLITSMNIHVCTMHAHHNQFNVPFIHCNT